MKKKAILAFITISIVIATAVQGQRIPSNKESFSNLQALSNLLVQYEQSKTKGDAEIQSFISANSSKISQLYLPAMKELATMQALVKKMTQSAYDKAIYDMLLKNGSNNDVINAIKNQGGCYMICMNSKNDINAEVLEINPSIKIVGSAIPYNQPNNLFHLASYNSINFFKLKCVIYFAGTLVCAYTGNVGCAVSTAASGYVCLLSKS